MLPELFLKRMQEQLGDEYRDFLASYEQDRHQALRLNTLKRTESGESMEKALTALFHMERVPWAQAGFYYDGETAPGKHPYHEAGLYYIQEPSAMAPAGFLDVQPGDCVLDLCAAPGGKSTQIGALLKGEGLLVSNEIHPARAKILSENVERMGLANVCVTNETPEHLAQAFPLFFDHILVDAPCSGEGMFRKNEIALTEWSEDNVLLCSKRQDEILDEAVKMLRPGGRMVYSTCTFAEAENEGSIQRFLARHSDMHLVQGLKFTASGDNAASDNEAASGDHNISFNGMLRLYPHKVRGEGHFLAVMQKEGVPRRGFAQMSEGADRGNVKGSGKGFGKGSGKDHSKGGAPDKEWEIFCDETLRRLPEALFYEDAANGRYLFFGDQLYLVPAGLPELKGLKVLRPGLHLGTMLKNRFEPSHALALALGPKDVRHVCRLSSNDLLVRQYLNGQTFAFEGEKGWYLICVDGISIGWGKLAGGIMKNHYPKGLRV